MNFKIIILGLIIFIIGCAGGSGSMEFTSAKTAARTEKNLSKAEEWGVKALNIGSDSLNAHVPYFLAVEVYRKQNPPQWIKMAEMFDEAIRRNPEQKLETPKYLIDPEKITKENYEESIAKTIQEGVSAYREQEWINVYNKSLDYFEQKDIENTIKYLEIAKKIDIDNDKNYTFLSQIYIMEKKYNKALKTANEGIKYSKENPDLFTILGAIHSEQGDLIKAKKMYNIAIELSSDPGPIMRQLSFVYIDLGESDKAITLSKSLLDKYSDDPDLYYNIAVVYQRLVRNNLDDLTAEFNKLMASELPDTEELSATFTKFKKLENNAKEARINFLSSSDLSIDDKSAKECIEASKEMRKLLRQIDEIYLPSLIDLADKLNIKLQ